MSKLYKVAFSPKMSPIAKTVIDLYIWFRPVREQHSYKTGYYILGSPSYHHLVKMAKVTMQLFLLISKYNKKSWCHLYDILVKKTQLNTTSYIVFIDWEITHSTEGPVIVYGLASQRTERSMDRREGPYTSSSWWASSCCTVMVCELFLIL